MTYSVTYKVPGAPRAGRGLEKMGPEVRKWAQITGPITGTITGTTRGEEFHRFFDVLGRAAALET